MSVDMETVRVHILDKDYQVACPAAEREGLLESARYLDQQMRAIRPEQELVPRKHEAVLLDLLLQPVRQQPPAERHGRKGEERAPGEGRQSVAQKVANAAGRAAAKPMLSASARNYRNCSLSGSMRVRKSSGANLTVGGTFALNFPQSGVNGVLCRVEHLTLPAPGQGEVAISFVEDTGFFNAAHYAAEADTPLVETVFEVQALAYEKLVEAPWGLKETSTPFIVFLAARGDVVNDGFNLWKQRTDLSYRDVGAFDSFAQRAHVVTEYLAGTLLIDDYIGLEIQFPPPTPATLHSSRSTHSVGVR